MSASAVTACKQQCYLLYYSQTLQLYHNSNNNVNSDSFWGLEPWVSPPGMWGWCWGSCSGHSTPFLKLLKLTTTSYSQQNVIVSKFYFYTRAPHVPWPGGPPRPRPPRGSWTCPAGGSPPPAAWCGSVAGSEDTWCKVGITILCRLWTVLTRAANDPSVFTIMVNAPHLAPQLSPTPMHL